MGNLLPAGALGRQLQWGDFATRQANPPKPGQTVSAAFTQVVRKLSPGRFSFTKAAYLKPPNFKMKQDPDVEIVFDRVSWVLSWVPGSAQDPQLLEHEQGHYDISSLNAADMFTELQDIASSAFVSAQAGNARVSDTFKRLGKTQPIHDKYDKDTNHGQKLDRQALWTAAFKTARLPGETLLSALSKGGLYP